MTEVSKNFHKKGPCISEWSGIFRKRVFVLHNRRRVSYIVVPPQWARDVYETSVLGRKYVEDEASYKRRLVRRLNIILFGIADTVTS